MILGATGGEEERTFGYPLGLVEIVICWRSQVKPPGTSPPSAPNFFRLIRFFRILKTVTSCPWIDIS